MANYLLHGLKDVAQWYTPGVAQPCKAISARPQAAYELTNKHNTVAVVSDGSRMLGLGNIGALASLPVMEGKAKLFNYLGGVDTVPICLATQNADEIVSAVCAIAPAFGGINLEDIEYPKCVGILEALRTRLTIPVWHDDQQGLAVVVIAALTKALLLLSKQVASARIVLIGRDDIYAGQEDRSEKWRICQESNGAQCRGGIA